MTIELFQSEAWFSNLAAHGFEQPPLHHCVALSPALAGRPACLHLMQRKPGAPLEGLSNYYSGLFGPAWDVAGQTDVDWAEVARGLRRLPGSAVFTLQPLDGAASWVELLEVGLRAAGYRCRRYFRFGNWYQTVPEGRYPSYWAERPSALRHTVERGRRRLDKAGDWRIDIVTGAPSAAGALDKALEAYEMVYARSWKQPEPCPAFMPGLVQTAAREGWLRLGTLHLNDEPLAAQLWLVYAGKANIFKLAYAQGWERFSPGSVLTAALMQHVMDVDRVQEVDFLAGDDAYKVDWMAQRRERIGLVACNMRSLLGLLTWTADHLRRVARPTAHQDNF